MWIWFSRTLVFLCVCVSLSMCHHSIMRLFGECFGSLVFGCLCTPHQCMHLGIHLTNAIETKTKKIKKDKIIFKFVRLPADFGSCFTICSIEMMMSSATLIFISMLFMMSFFSLSIDSFSLSRFQCLSIAILIQHTFLFVIGFWMFVAYMIDVNLCHTFNYHWNTLRDRISCCNTRPFQWIPYYYRVGKMTA